MQKKFKKLNFLFSHAFLREKEQIRKVLIEIAKQSNVLIDSGAFTNFTMKKKKTKSWQPITINEYVRACKEDYKHMWQYIMLDVIMDEDATNRNLEVMADAGLKPMTVLTPTAPIEEAEKLLQYSDYIAVSGGATGFSSNFIRGRVNKIDKMSKGKAKIHALGFMRHPVVFKMPLTSMDSSSMGGGSRFGTVSTYDRFDGFVSCHWSELQKPKNQKHERILGTLMNNGISIEMLKDKESYRTWRSIPTYQTVFSYLQYANHTYEKGFGLFFSTMGVGWINIILATVGASDGIRYDYQTAIDLNNKLDDLLKENKDDEYIDLTRSIIQEKVEWQSSVI
jgi:hypothetical protein